MPTTHSDNWRVQRILNVATKYGWIITPSTATKGCFRLRPPGTEPFYDDGFTVFSEPNNAATVMRGRDWMPIAQSTAMGLIASR